VDSIAVIDSESTSVVGPDISADPDTGIVDGDPSSMAHEAGLTLDQYSLARMCASEEGRGPGAYLLAVAECAVNTAARRKVSVSDLLLKSSRSQGAGKFSQQGLGKWASTSRPATRKSVAAAKAALAGSNFTKGSRDYFSPSGQVVGSKQGVTTIKTSSEKYIQDRKEEDLVWVGDLPGIDPTRLMIFIDKNKISNPEENITRSEGLVFVPSIVAFMFLTGSVIFAMIAGGVKVNL